jgi:hypothetical protein
MSFKHTPIILATAIAFGCAEGAVTPTVESDGLTLQASVGSGRVIHRVAVGGPDICSGTGGSPGCDANFSLVALQYADGRVSGQWHDQSVPPFGGVHVSVDCLVVVGNDAWLSGVGPDHEFGNKWVTRVRDNGTGTNGPADQLTFTYPVGGPAAPALGGVRLDCNATQDYVLFEAPQGQVVVD